MKFSNKNFFNKCDQILSFLRIWSNLLKKFLMKNLILCAVRDYGVVVFLRILPNISEERFLKHLWMAALGYGFKQLAIFARSYIHEAINSSFYILDNLLDSEYVFEYE